VTEKINDKNVVKTNILLLQDLSMAMALGADNCPNRIEASSEAALHTQANLPL
jgi:hypothetical protein